VRRIKTASQAGAALAWLNGHVGEPATVKEIAAGAGVSENTVRRLVDELADGRLTVNDQWPRGYYLRGTVRP
jgi:DNA-binding IclR family transcriptional regulator